MPETSPSQSPVITEQFEAIISEVRNLTRRFDSLTAKLDTIQKGIDIVDGDRQIMEDQVQILREVKGLLQFFRDNQAKDNKALKADISEVREQMVGTGDQVKEAVAENIGQLIEVVNSKQNKRIVINTGFFGRLFKRGK